MIFTISNFIQESVRETNHRPVVPFALDCS
jgi:hypothetical protein